MELNLLGLTVDEALPEVDAYIDRAILNGQTVVYLIHGNGTGALRTAIHKHLRGNRMVKSFRLGRYGEGESGVTVVSRQRPSGRSFFGRAFLIKRQGCHHGKTFGTAQKKEKGQ